MTSPPILASGHSLGCPSVRLRRRRPSPKLKQMPREPANERKKKRRRGAHLILLSPSAPILPLPSLLPPSLRLNYHAVSIFPMENKRSLVHSPPVAGRGRADFASIAARRTHSTTRKSVNCFGPFGQARCCPRHEGGRARGRAERASNGGRQINCMQDGCTYEVTNERTNESSSLVSPARWSCNCNFWVK